MLAEFVIRSLVKCLQVNIVNHFHLRSVGDVQVLCRVGCWGRSRRAGQSECGGGPAVQQGEQGSGSIGLHRGPGELGLQRGGEGGAGPEQITAGDQ